MGSCPSPHIRPPPAPLLTRTVWFLMLMVGTWVRRNSVAVPSTFTRSKLRYSWGQQHRGDGAELPPSLPNNPLQSPPLLCSTDLDEGAVPHSSADAEGCGVLRCRDRALKPNAACCALGAALGGGRRGPQGWWREGEVGGHHPTLPHVGMGGVGGEGSACECSGGCAACGLGSLHGFGVIVCRRAV